jgi:hypothetical protein
MGEIASMERTRKVLSLRVSTGASQGKGRGIQAHHAVTVFGQRDQQSSGLTAGIQDRETLMAETLLDVVSDVLKVLLASCPSRSVLVQVTERWIVIEQRPANLTNHVRHQ